MLYLAYTKTRVEVIWLKSHHGHLKISLNALSAGKTQTIGRWCSSGCFLSYLEYLVPCKVFEICTFKKKIIWRCKDIHISLVNNNSIPVHMLGGQEQMLGVYFITVYHIPLREDFSWSLQLDWQA